MPDTKASGADSGGAARNREHNQGNQGRSYTVEQKAAVLRIRRCNATDFYDILGLESVKKTCTEAEVKKAYRKQSLLTHPDKNGHEHADEAFKMVSRAFGVLGDKEKRDKFDRFGGDPDSRFSSAQAQNPFAGFGSRGGGGMGGQGPMFHDDISPEEMFARFFSGAGGGFGQGGFGGQPFVFNFGGGPGIRVHQFGGNRPRARPRQPGQNGPMQGEETGLQNLIGLLPILIFFIFPFIMSIFGGGDSVSSGPSMVWDTPVAPWTEPRTMPNYKVSYFVKPSDIKSYTPSKLKQLDRTAELKFVRELQHQCSREKAYQQQIIDDATGWFFDDPVRISQAQKMPLPNCERLTSLGLGRY